MKKIFLILVVISNAITLFSQNIFEYEGIAYKIVKEADESSTFGTVIVTEKSDDFYAGVVEIPNAVKQISDGYEDSYKVVGIDAFAFRGSPVLSVVKCPITIESIGESAFESCSNMITVEFAEGCILKTIGESVFAYSGIKTITIRGELEILPRFTFRDCKELEEVKLPESLRIIGISAFINCTSLHNIELPSKLTDIQICAFCFSGIKRIVLPKKVTVIQNSSFCGCKNLTEVELSPYTTKIDCSAFAGCDVLTTINKPQYLKDIHPGSFSGCTAIPDYYK